MSKILLLALGGALGAIARYSVSGIVFKHMHVFGVFPFGTLVVNVSGALIIGILWGAWMHGDISSNIGTFLFIGLLGSFTTFSTFSIETLNLFRMNEIKIGILNILANNILSLVMVYVGFIISRAFINVCLK
ncbi:MAG: fluoride efflux transporter CrcB [Bacteroidetes bacterium]|nr:fluoride efflux transporter CrcB [Bacteroidota bacterium]